MSHATVSFFNCLIAGTRRPGRLAARTGQKEFMMTISYNGRPAPSIKQPGNSLAYVYDGRECLGHVLDRGKLGFAAFDRDDKSVGVFETQRQAANPLLVKEWRDMSDALRFHPLADIFP